MSEPRLREFRSTHPKLIEGELVIAFLAPVANRVHFSSTIIREDGRFEFADRLSGPPGHNTVYHKESGQVGDELLGRLRAQLELLAAAAAEAHPFSPEDVDFDDYETRDRRQLSYWNSGSREDCSVWSAELYEDHGVAPASVERYRAHFDSLWRLILPLIEFPLFQSESPVAGEAWTFPLRSVEAAPWQRRN